MRVLRSNKQAIELFCLIVSLPLVFLNIELHLSDLYPKHSSVAAAVNYRKVRQLSFENLEETDRDNVSAERTDNDVFNEALKLVMKEEQESRQRKVMEVCQENVEELSWTEDDLFQHLHHKDVWDVIHRVVFCPIAKVRLHEVSKCKLTTGFHE